MDIVYTSREASTAMYSASKVPYVTKERKGLSMLSAPQNHRTRIQLRLLRAGVSLQSRRTVVMPNTLAYPDAMVVHFLSAPCLYSLNCSMANDHRMEANSLLSTHRLQFRQ